MASLNHAKITNALDAIVAKCDKSSFFFDFLLAYGTRGFNFKVQHPLFDS